MPPAVPEIFKSIRRKVRSTGRMPFKVLCYHHGCSNAEIAVQLAREDTGIHERFDGAEGCRWDPDEYAVIGFYLVQPATCPTCRARFTRAFIIAPHGSRSGIATMAIGYEAEGC